MIRGSIPFYMRSALFYLVLVSVPSWVWAQDSNSGVSPKAAVAAGLSDAQLLEASGAIGDKFRSSYESGDAAGLSALFTDLGEFIDSERVAYSGRKNIATEFAALFDISTDRKMKLVVDSVRQVSEGVVIEDGHAWIQTGVAGSTTVSQYCSVMVRQGGEWKIASLRDIKSEYASPADYLDALAWITGEWIDESDAGVVEYQFSRSPDNNFIVGDYRIRSSDEKDFVGTIRVGWDPVTKQFKSWSFDSEGGVSVGHWNALEEGWIIKNVGTRSDGATGSSTNYYEQVDDGRIVWKSFDRHVGGEKQPDVEVTLVRRPPVPGAGDAASVDSENGESK